MKFDAGAYAAASRTYKIESWHHVLAGRPVLIERHTTEVPGKFVNGGTEYWSVSIHLGALNIMGRSEATEVVGRGDTRDEAIADAENTLQSKGR